MATYLVWRNKVISMIRGDYFSFKTKVIKPTEFDKYVVSGTNSSPEEIEPYQMKENDIVYFFLSRPNDSFEQSLLVKKYVSDDQDGNGEIIIDLTPDDTAYLRPGDYYYTVKLVINAESSEDEEVYTIIPKTKFLIVD